MLITISYVVFIIFIASVFVYRIKKQKFASFLNEEIGILSMCFILSLIVDVSIVIKAIAVASVLAIFMYGSVKK
ncbi:hypothetical protein [Paenibacillus sp. UMB4589-SE434]|uniref:hypothetical protein n=1 Tax=Paenibacillus sp. UMB4589-SE434 TaxID=3046314 RepID=UPI00254C261C|nr:hypothetical protein [Paenibacillus sp. UMB4589-SE434]MDK8179318.1 hypothetical protein [Paenibacillus sp. UMB4589-SE434]